MSAHDHRHPTDHDRGHEHDHGHDHDVHDHDEHDHGHGVSAMLRHFLGGGGHTHDAAEQVDSALESSDVGIRALKISLVVLAVTAILQAVVVAVSGSVALLGDTLHNFADAATALPLWMAFSLGRRAPTRRYTYGFGKAEDLAGIFIVLVVAASAAAAGYEAVDRLLHPRTVSHLGFVAAAGLVGFVGNEIAAQYRIRTGRRIGSAALVADGVHARTDGLTSLAVLVGATGVALGFRAADPIAGLVITIAILLVLRSAARGIYYRLMDAVNPELVDAAGHVIEHVPGVAGLDTLRLRWVGHRLHAEVEITVAGDLSAAAAHEIAHQAHHALLHGVPRLDTVIVHASPAAHGSTDPHAVLAHHADGVSHEHDSDGTTVATRRAP